MNINLAPTPTIDSEHPLIKAKTHELVDGLSESAAKIEAIFNFVRDGIRYSMYAANNHQEGYKASFILTTGQGWCLQKSILFTALARAAGVPARIVLASLKNYRAPEKALIAIGTTLFMPHVYAEAFFDEKWVKLAPIFNHSLCKFQSLPTVRFAGSQNAMLPGKDLDGNPYIEYVDDFGSFADIPWESLVAKNREVYGEKTSSFWFAHDF